MSWPHMLSDRHSLSFGVRRGRFTCVGKTGRLFDGKRIHVGAQHDIGTHFSVSE